MWWQSTLIRFLLAMALMLCLEPAHAKQIELAIMPGDVTHAHAKLEEQCSQCHVPFDRQAQSGLCLDCHKDVARDVANKQGYHGRIKQDDCKSCHTEHKGRAAQIVKLDTKAFDHTLTDYQLAGKHQQATCDGCHLPDKKHREATTDCVSCHRKADKHKGYFGERCTSCHTEAGWKQLTFQHDKDTKFALKGKHQQASCTGCHTKPLYQKPQPPSQCIGCHRKDDAHKRSLGERCVSCHSETAWKGARFNHNTKTQFTLQDRHAAISCNSCHTPGTSAKNLPQTCYSCHGMDDERKGHQGRFGRDCGSCHNQKSFKPSTFNHARATDFPLKYAHSAVKCASCHTGANIHDKVESTCTSCHQKDDMAKGHKGFYGQRCESCHNEKSFKQSIFNHDRDTRYPLVGRHQQASCTACHKDPPALVKTSNQCTACHTSDDIHFGTYSQQCGQCHTPVDWRQVKKQDSEVPR